MLPHCQAATQTCVTANPRGFHLYFINFRDKFLVGNVGDLSQHLTRTQKFLLASGEWATAKRKHCSCMIMDIETEPLKAEM